MRTAVYLAFGALGTLMVAGGAAAMLLEGGTYLTGPTTASARILSMDSTPLPLSIEAQRDGLTDCFVTLRDKLSFEYIELTAEQQTELPQRCRSRADAIVAMAPSYSLAWYVGALASADLQDWGGMNDRLLHSQETGRYEQWIGQMRVSLAEANLGELSPEVAIGHDRDLQMLVQTDQGVRSIADRYVQDTAFRERITAIVEALPIEDQRRFLTYLRRRAN